MGYYTRHTLSIYEINEVDNTNKINELKSKLKDLEDYKEIKSIIDQIEKLENYDVNSEILDYIENDNNMQYALSYGLGEEGNECKWYSHESDMKEMSKQFPHIVFKLEGEGEESGDIWKEYYKNGKMQRCQAKLVFDDYDINKLE